jgi:aminomethyltransferase
MLTQTLKETPLAELHKNLGARMVDFAGWNMPVQYRSIIKEHMAVRQAAGLFDVCHMGEFTVTGDAAKPFIQHIIGNDLEKLSKPNCALYTQFINETGGTVDDLIVYRRQNDYLLVVNASNIDKDWQWINRFVVRFPGVKLGNESDQTGLLALQGPKAAAIMQKLAGSEAAALPGFHYRESTIGGITIGCGRTGYTGEDGFEIFVAADKACQLWQIILKAGEPFGIEPCGLGARDTLRLEAALPLYGHELDDETSPLEAGLGFSVSLSKSDYIGKEKLLAQKKGGFKKQLICLATDGKALPRQGYKIKAPTENNVIGTVTSGSQGIAVGYPIAMGYVPPQYAKVGTKLQIEIRDSDVAACVVSRPFYKAQKS